jgi:tetratricopeptide (TPR) repeat protein
VQRRHLSCFFLIICILLIVSTAAAQVDAILETQQGKQALGQGKYDEAIQHLERVLQANPKNLNAELYLATAYARKYVPGVNKEDNIALADQAIQHYQTVMERDTFSTMSHNAAMGIALLYAQMNKFDEAKDYYSRAKQLDPKDPQPFYFTALVDWTLANQVRTQARTKLGLKPPEFLADKDHKVCIEVRGKNLSGLEEGTENLTQALKLNPLYEEATNYMNLMYLERADIECDDPTARKADLKSAADWALKLQTVRAKKAYNAAHPPKDDDDDQ